MTWSAARSFFLTLAVVSAFQGIVFGSIAVESPGSLSRWAVTVVFASLYSAIVGLPPALGFFLLAPRARRFGLALRSALLLGIFPPLVGVSFLVARAIALTLQGGVSGSDRPLLPQVLGIASLAVLAVFLRDAQVRLRDEALARERTLRLAADAQLSSLESRVRPHFLFNSLNSVLALIPDDPKRAEAVLERLTALLRASLELRPTGLVSLAEEMVLVTDYLEIERVRFGARLTYTVDVPADLEAVHVPAFSVQTLVENSVKHAVASRREGARLEITAAAEGNGVVVVVGDDGPGFGGGLLPAGHGLDTLRARLGVLFEHAGSLEIDGAAGRTRVTMRVPAARRAA